MNRNIFIFVALALLVVLPLGGCRVRYSLQGGSLSQDVQSFSVAYFPNNASMVSPILSTTLTDALVDRFDRQYARLTQLREGGDVSFEGEIVGYTSTPTAIAGDEYAVLNRLTITVSVRFTNIVEPQFNFNRTFTQYLEYDASRLLQEVEPSLIPEIVDMLVDDIFNAATSNW